jgi:hypothetical protein
MGQAIFSLRRSSSRMLEALRAEDSIHPQHVPIVQPLRFVQTVQSLTNTDARSKRSNRSTATLKSFNGFKKTGELPRFGNARERKGTIRRQVARGKDFPVK